MSELTMLKINGVGFYAKSEVDQRIAELTAERDRLRGIIANIDRHSRQGGPMSQDMWQIPREWIEAIWSEIDKVNQ